MARLPDTYERRRPPNFGQPMARISSAGMVGRAVEGIGGELGRLSDVSNKLVVERAGVEAAAAETEAVRRMNEALYDPEKGFLATTKENTVKGYDGARERIDAIASESLAGLDDRSARLAKAALDARVTAAYATIDRHTASERRNWLEGTANARATLAADDALRAATDDAAVDVAIGEGVAALEGFWARDGLSEEERAVKRSSYVSTSLRNVAIKRAEVDPIGAYEWAKKEFEKGRINATDMAQIEPALLKTSRDYEGREIARKAITDGAPIRYETEGKVRSLPLAGDTEAKLTMVVRAADPSVSIAVVSAGQPQKGSGAPRIGSTRHDVDETGKGHTADIVLMRDGKKILPDEDPELYAKVIEEAARYFPGIGHYKWGIHIGGGQPAFWGPNTRADTADPRFKAAYDRGRKLAMVEGPPPASGESPLTRVLKETEGKHPSIRDAALAEYSRNEALMAAEARRKREEMERTVYEHVLSGGSMKDVPIEVRSMLGRAEDQALLQVERDMISGTDRKTDPSIYYRLRTMAETDPNGFRGLNLMDPEIANGLSLADFKKFADDQAKVRGGGAIEPTYSGIKTAVDRVAPGLYDFSKAGDTTDGKKAHVLWMAMKNSVDAYVQREGKKPSESEMMDMARGLIAEVETSGAWWITGGGMNTETVAALAQTMRENFAAGEPVTINDEEVTPKMMQDALDAYGLDAPQTEEELIGFWLRVQEERANMAASRETEPRNYEYSPSALRVPETDATPTQGGLGRRYFLALDAQMLDVPYGDDPLGDIMTRSDEVADVAIGQMALPGEGDDKGWTTLGNLILRGVSRGAVRLSNGVEITARDWATANEELPDASVADVAKRVVEIAMERRIHRPRQAPPRRRRNG